MCVERTSLYSFQPSPGRPSDRTCIKNKMLLVLWKIWCVTEA